MALLDGEHVSTDVAVLEGKPVWWRHATGVPLQGGMFDHWVIWAESRPALEDFCGKWIEANLSGYTGMVNLETIGGGIIEAHLRFADQWPDLYGSGWVEALVDLYAHRQWTYPDNNRRTGYSVVLFGAHGVKYQHPAKTLIDALLQAPGVTSIQITFHEDRPGSSHSMPPGGFRLAIINGFDLEAQRGVREQLALSYWSTQQLLPRRGRRPATVSDSRAASPGS